MATTGNQHCANCIGTLSFPIFGLGLGLDSVHVLQTSLNILVKNCTPSTCRPHHFTLPSNLADNLFICVFVRLFIIHLWNEIYCCICVDRYAGGALGQVTWCSSGGHVVSWPGFTRRRDLHFPDRQPRSALNISKYTHDHCLPTSY